MAEIDFLPIEFHQRNARQKVQPWRVVVVACAVMLLAAAVVAQQCQKQQTQRDLDAATAGYEAAAAQNDRWEKFEARLQAVRSEAEMFTYLRHPWPRSRLIAAFAGSLPKEITVYQIQIAGETPTELPAVDTRSRAEIKADEDKLHKAPAAQRDAKRLHDEFDRERTFVRIAGVTSDAMALYRFLGVVGKDSYFAKVELRSIESVDTPQGPVMHFQAFLQVRPGYGQPGGPKGNHIAMAVHP